MKREKWKVIIGIFVSLVIISAISGSRSTQKNSVPYYVFCNGVWQNGDKGCPLTTLATSSFAPAAPAAAVVATRTAQPQATGNVFCNGVSYSPCASGSQFSCPASVPAQCLTQNISTAPPPRTIVAKANVGLLCHYKITDLFLKAIYSYAEDSSCELLLKASGIIVNPRGYILTAKHLVDPQWVNWAYASTTSAEIQRLNDSLQFDYCDVGVPQIDNLPTPDEVKTVNPSLQLTNPFPYVATSYFEPSHGNLSDLEYREMDFAVLKITGPLHNCKPFNLCDLPTTFPYNPVLYDIVPGQPNMTNQLINFGYPAEAINSYGGGFTDFYLHGAVGPLITYYGGDQYFKDKPLRFEWKADDILSGRSGSPIYWQGYIVGIVSAVDTTNTTISYAIGMPAIYQTLKDNNLEWILATE